MSTSNDHDSPPKSAPTHGGEDEEKKTLNEAIAVALKYDPQSTGAPQVVAGGRGHIAEQIMQIAFERGIKVRKDADLAQILSVIDIDSEIPLEAFAAVAEILVYVYRANNRLDELHGGAKPSDKADDDDDDDDDPTPEHQKPPRHKDRR